MRFGVIAFFVVEATTFGWRFFSPTPIPSPRNEELSHSLEQHVQKLSNELGVREVFNYSSLEKASTYIQNRFRSYGYKVELQTYNCDGLVSNIIATKQGSERPDEVVIIGAHYDSAHTKGADDNASGVAALLELSRMLSTTPLERTIKFIAFVNEEPPWFGYKEMGSYQYAQKVKAEKTNVKAVVVFDMIGFYSGKTFSQRYPPFLGPFYPNRGNFLAVTSNLASRHLVTTFAMDFRKHSPLTLAVGILPDTLVPPVTYSDHRPFLEAGYKGLMITNTAFYRNKNYHKTTDTWDTLNYPYMAEFVAAFQAPLMELANSR